MLLLTPLRPAGLATKLQGFPAWRRALAWHRRLSRLFQRQESGLVNPNRALSWWETVLSLGERAEFLPETGKLEFLSLWAQGDPGWIGQKVTIVGDRPKAELFSPGQSFAGSSFPTRRRTLEGEGLVEDRFFLEKPLRSSVTFLTLGVLDPWPGGRVAAAAPRFGLLRELLPGQETGLFEPPRPVPVGWPGPSSKAPENSLLPVRDSGYGPGGSLNFQESFPRPGFQRILGEEGEEITPPGSWAWWAARSAAAPLGAQHRPFLEKIFPDLDLDRVGLHTDAAADNAARSLGAEAFAAGREIFFQAGRFNLATARGLALLGHELVHIRQMTAESPSRRLVRGNMLELEARRLEGHLLQALPLVAVDPVGADLEPTFPGPRAYAPPTLELSQWGGAQIGADRAGLASPGEHFTSGDGIPSSAWTGPLTAEAGRDLSLPASTSAAAGAAGDPDALSRGIFRSLARKIIIDQERRGVDRWER